MAHASGGHVQPGYAVLTQAIPVLAKTRSTCFITLMMLVHVPHLTVALLTQPLHTICQEPWELQNPLEICSALKMVIILYVDIFIYTLH